MGKIVVINHLSLDGVMQSPARPDEDERENFKYGGWANIYSDTIIGQSLGERMGRKGGGLLLGRRTYEDFHSFWTKQKSNPYTDQLNRGQKYVVSKTLKEPLPWMNTTLLKGNIVEAVGKLKNEIEGDLVVMGSGKLIPLLMEHQLVDEFLITINPILLGSGQRMFPEQGIFTPLQLVDWKMSSTGVFIATYRPTELQGESPFKVNYEKSLTKAQNDYFSEKPLP